jgi:hypothetical protein
VLSVDEIHGLRGNSLAWRLLNAENAPLVLSFLDQVFVTENARSIDATELASELDDELYALNERLGERTFPKQAKAYLDDWAAPDTGWLRKYYPEGSDEPHYDVPPPWRRPCRGSGDCRPDPWSDRVAAEYDLSPAAADGVRRRNRPRGAAQGTARRSARKSPRSKPGRLIAQEAAGLAYLSRHDEWLRDLA